MLFLKQALSQASSSSNKHKKSNTNVVSIEESLKVASNLSFKLQVLSAETVNYLQHSTATIHAQLQKCQDPDYLQDALDNL